MDTKNKIIKRFMAFVLSLAMIVTYMPVSMIAYAGADDSASEVSEEVVSEEPKAESEQAAEPQVNEEPATIDKSEPEAVTEPVTEPNQTDEIAPTDEAATSDDAENVETDQTQPSVDEVQIVEPQDIEPDEELEYPEADFTGTAGGVDVSVHAPQGALPAGTVMKVKNVLNWTVSGAVKDELGDNAKVVKAVDITFYNSDGEEIQPKENISVVFNYADFADLEQPAVVHIDADKNVEKLADKKVETNGEEVVFETKDFSIYAVIETVVPRLTVYFKNGTTDIETMYVKAADTAAEVDEIIHDPGVGTIPAGQVFKGWTTDEAYTANSVFMTIDEVRADAMARAAALNGADGSVTYYAAMFKQYTMTYVDGAGITVGTEAAETPSRLTEAQYKVNMGYVTDDTHNFEGWTPVDGMSNISGYPENAHEETIGSRTVYYYENGTELTVTGNVKFSVDAPEGHWLVFDENGKGATYNAPRFIKAGEVTSVEGMLDMVRNGYTFKGWYTGAPSETGGDPTGSEFSFGGQITETTTIYAKWEAISTAQYTVLIWKQNLAGDGYDFVEAVHPSGSVGTTPTAVNATNGRVTGATYTGETGFSYKETDQASKKIAPEGNTVVNVYWDRNEYTLTFQAQGVYTYTPTTSNTGTQYGLVDGEYIQLTRSGNNPYTWSYGTGEYTYTPTTGNDGTQYGLVNGEYVQLTRWNGNWYSGFNQRYNGTRYLRSEVTERYTGTRYTRSGGGNQWSTVKTITALYGQSIGDNFPIVGPDGTTYDGHYRWDPQDSDLFNEVVVYIDTMPAESVTFRAEEATSTQQNRRYDYMMRYYVEALPGATDTVTHGGKTYSLYTSVKAFYNHVTIEDYLDLIGFTKFDPTASTTDYSYTERTIDGTNYRVVDFYYTRNHYSLNFMDGAYVDGNGNPIDEINRGQLHEISEISYAADLTSYNKDGENYYEPDAPTGYVFEGWYIDSACTHAYDFTTMPEGGITVYAKWRQIQYRVFLHPNAGTDSTLTWGSDNQGMNFRVAYGGKISVPTGQRTGYEFFGWYIDEDCTQAFTANAQIRGGSAYDKTTDFTDPMDKWGNGATSNADVDRFWITEKFGLYAKWSAIIVGADGIGVLYDANGGSNAPSDTALYKDNSNVTAGAAPTAPNGKVFDHWALQTWNGTEYVDLLGSEIPAGGTFTVLKNYARIQDAATQADVAAADVVETGKYTYTVKLKAVYKDVEEETPTHIDFYSNYGSENDGKGTLYKTYTDIKINDAVNIYGLSEGESTPTRDGYTFKGWTKTKGGTTADFLVWDGTKYTATVNGNTHVVTQVAADEKQPYDDVFAVWEENDVTINYAVAEDSEGMGTVDPTSETIKAVSGTAAGSTATATSSTYIIDYWTCDDGTEHVGDAAKFVPSKEDGIYVAYTYYAHFKLNKAQVTVHHYLKGTTTKVAEDTVTQETIGTEINPSEVPAATTFIDTYASYNLTKDSTDPTQAVTVTENGVEITLYYTLPLSITASTASKSYDGTALNGSYTISGELSSDTDTIEDALGTAPSITDVGSVDYLTEEEQAEITDIPGYYTVEYHAGKLTITKDATAIVITSATNSWTYNGSNHTDETYTVTYGEKTVTADESGKVFTLENGDVITITATAAGVTNVSDNAENNNTYTYTVKRGNTDSSDNYESITANIGTLTINPKAVTITAKDANKAYDGDPLTESGFTATALETGDTHTFNVTMTEASTITDVGSQPNVIATVDGTAVTTGTATAIGNYTVTTADGNLTVTEDESALVITSATNSWTYDGSNHKDETYTVTYKGEAVTADDTGKVFTLPNGDVITITATTEGVKDVADNASNNNTYTYTIKRGSADASANYKSVVANYGTLTINPKEVTITADNAEQVYNGTALTEDGFTATALETGDDHTFTVVMTEGSTITNVGSEPNVIATVDGVAVSTAAPTAVGNYMVTVANGTLTVTQRPITITAESASKVYDGKSLTNPAVTTGYQAFLAEGDTLTDVTVTGTITQVGSVPNVASAAVIKNAAGTDVTANYNIAYAPGTLTVTKSNKIITITSADGSWTYDGSNHTKVQYTVQYGPSDAENPEIIKGTEGQTEFTLSTGDKVTITAADTAKVKNVSDSAAGKNTFTYVVENANQYETPVTVYGSLTIVPRTVILNSETASKEYDGTPLTRPNVTEGEGSEGFVEGEAVSIQAIGTITEIGEAVKNVIDIVFGENYKAENYTITKNEGDLSITANTSEIKVVPGSDSKVYDGTALTKTAHGDFTVTGVPDGFTWEATADGTVTNVTPGAGEKAVNAVTSFKIFNADGKDVTNQFSNIDTTATGILTITPRPVTFTGESDEREFTGSEIELTGITTEGLLSGHTDNVTYSAKGTDVGEYDGTITAKADVVIMNGTVNVTSNYNITTTPGKLTITQTEEDLTVSLEDKTYEYDAADHALPTAATTNAASGTTTIQYSFDEENWVTDLSTLTKKYVGKYTVHVRATNPNYINTATSSAVLEITQKPITITAASDSKVYDGTPLTKDAVTDGYKESLAGDDALVSVTVTGTITLVGTEDNVPSAAVIKNGDTDVTENYNITYANGTLEITDGTPDDPVDPALVVTKADDKAADYKYAEGETVTFNITVKNIFAEAKTITLSEIAGVTLADTTFEDVEAGETVTTTATYTITAADLAAGSFTNTVTATLNGKSYQATDAVNTEDVAAALTVEKTADKTEGLKVGDTVTYTVKVTNSGNTTVTGIALTDTLVTLNQAAFDLAPGASKDGITYTYTVTQADVDTGKIVNTVTAKGKDPKNADVTGTASKTVTTETAAPEITVTKSTDKTEGIKAGDKINYTVTVTNTGNVTLSDVALDDTMDLLKDAEKAIGTLAPGDDNAKTFTYEYTVLQADVDAGSIVNTATASGKYGETTVNDSKNVTVTTVTAAPALTVEKTAEPASNVAAGGTVTYTVTVTNSGNVTVKDIVLTDTLVTLTDEQKAVGTLAPGGTKSITYTYTVTQANVDAGSFDNTATATGTYKGENVTDSKTATVTTVASNAKLEVTKTADKTEKVKVGDEITYTVEVKNGGNVTLTDVTLDDSRVELPAGDAAVGTLAPNGTKTITYTYTVTQADVDAGKINNTVTATGKDPKGAELSTSANVEVTTVVAIPAIEVSKTADLTSGVEKGSKVTYTVTVTNTGNVTLSNVDISDALMADADKPAAFTLAPGEDNAQTFEYEYTVTQADVDAGKIVNTVTATGTYNDQKPTDTATATVTTVSAEPALTVEKTASPTEGVEVDDTVTYTVKVTNSGNVTVKGITLTDDKMATDAAPEAFDLAPGATSEDITYTYTVTQADVDAGFINNTATATGKDPAGEDVTAEDKARVTTVTPEPAITVTKTADPESGVEVGNTVGYTVVVKNTGNVTVGGITLNDTLVTLSETAFALAPGAEKAVTYNYAVTQADVDAGKIDNTVTATGAGPAAQPLIVTDSATVTTVTAAPELTVTKTASKTEDAAVGDTITYTVVVTNSGNVTVSGIAMSDTLVTLNEQAFNLAPNGTKTINYTYAVKQSDVDAGKIDNTVNATGTYKEAEVTKSASAQVKTVEANAALTVTKTADKTSGVKVGDTVTYTVVTENTGNVTVKDIALTDSLVTLNEAAFTLAPAETKSVTYTYTVTQADVDNGSIANTATAKGKDPKDAEVTASDDETVTTVEGQAALNVEKTAAPTSGVGVGATVTYTVVVTNSGNVTVSGITLADELMAEADAPDAFNLAPAGTKEIVYTYTVTQDDVDAGKIDNTATATGKDPKDNDVSASDSATVTAVDSDAKLTVTKTASKTTDAAVGDEITYTVTVKNDGNVTVKDIELTDTLVTQTEDAFNLTPGAEKEFTYTYTVTQTDVDKGEINNTAAATGKDPKGTDVGNSATVNVTTVTAAPELTVTKSADPASGVKVGDTVKYTVVVTNTGNVTVKDIALTDAKMAQADVPAVFTLAPEGTQTFTYNYTVTQADVDAGTIANTVKAAGTDPFGIAVEKEASATVTTVEADAQLAVTKTASKTTDAKVGDVITYTIEVSNPGNVTVKGIELEDTLVTLTEEAFDLAPAGKQVITYTYTVTQADVDNGKIENTVSATGKDPKSNDVTESAEATVTAVKADAKLTVTKTASKTTDAKVGDVITYTVEVSNPGNVTIKGIELEDTLVTLNEAAFDLAPNGTKTITYTYTVLQSDVDAGKIDNTVTATGKDPKDADVTASDDETVTAVTAIPALTVSKTASPKTGLAADAKVSYTVVVTNSGNVTVSGIAMSDTLVTLSEATFDLAPGADKTITYEYTVTQADVDAGKIDNTATATGKDPKYNEVTASDDATVTAVAADAKLTVEKTAEQKEGGYAVGEKVPYTVVVTNSGNVTVSGIEMSDTLVTLSEAAFDLAPAGTKTITYEYTVTQADVDAGKIDNTATATGKDPKDAEVTASDDAEVTTVAADASIKVTKTPSKSSGAAVNDVITYTISVENTGNVTVKGITLDDTLVELTGDSAAFDLAPGAKKEGITYTYTVTQADVDAGKIDNTVTATGKDPKGTDVTGEASATVTANPADAQLNVSKTADKTSNVKVGDTVTYTVVVSNPGNVTVSGIKLADTLVTPTGADAEAFNLAPNGSKTFEYTYTVTQGDVDAGKINNTASAAGKDPKETDVTASDSVEVTTVAADAELTVEKTANPTEDVKVGDSVEYTVVVTNSGNVTVSGIALTDPLATLGEDAKSFELAPNASKEIKYSYTVTQADVDAGKIDNTATAKGSDPKGTEVTASDNATVTTVTADAKLTVEKSADPATGVKVGDKVTYTVVVTNSGNVTVSGIKLADTLVTPAGANAEEFTLAPAGTKTLTYEYTVTQTDVDAGKIDNTATATGKDPKNEEVTASDDATVTTVAASGALTVSKTAEPASGVKVGDTVKYTVVVTNSGNVTLKGVALEDTLVTLTDEQKAIGDLAPAGTKTITYNYTVTQADIDAGKIDNTATAAGTDPKGTEVTGTDNATVTTVPAEAELTVEKTAEPTKEVKVGDKVAYTVVVTNSGNVTVSDIAMSDTLVKLNEAAFDLAPAETKTITYEYTVTQADVDAGKIDNTATATGKNPKGTAVTASDDATVATVASDAKLTVEKTAEPTKDVKVGDKVKYTVVVTNSGNVTVSGIAMSDTLVTLSEAAFDLVPAGTKTITYEYTVTQADVDAGKIDNTVTATGKDPKDAAVTATDNATVATQTAAGALKVTKQADTSAAPKVGDEITYTVIVENTGNVTISGIKLADTLVTPTGDNAVAFDLAPAGTKTFTYTYKVTQDDVDAGSITNTAAATGTDPSGKTVTDNDSVIVSTDPAAAKLTVSKTAEPEKNVAVGDEITYTVVVKNEGNVTVKDIAISDSLVTVNEAAFTLAPGAEKIVTYKYTATQADIDAGQIDNTATATGKDPKNADVTATGTATVTAEKSQPELSVTKTADPSENVKAGDSVEYTVVVENTGNVTVSSIALSDTLVTLAESTFELAPGAKKTVTYTYTATQADVDAGKIDNTVTATGTARDAEEVKAAASATVITVAADAGLTVEKTASKTTEAEVGDVITYTVAVTNSGNVTVSGIKLSDTLVTLTGANAEEFTLAPEASKTITYTYTVTQADVDAGKIDNTATAAGKDPKNANVTASDDEAVTAVKASASLNVTKTAGDTTGVGVGDKFTYAVVVENTGNVTVSSIGLTDTLVDLSKVAMFELAPGDKKSFTYEYTTTQADIDAGQIDNTVTAAGTDPKDKPVDGTASATVKTEDANATLAVEKTAKPDKDVAVGDKITYTVVATNEGNVTIKGITFEDTLVEIEEEAFDLAPGESKKVTYEYTVTQADVDKGSVTNAVTAKGTDPGDDPVPGSDDVTVPTEEKAPHLTVTKTAEPTEDVAVGDKITYTVTVTNDGNVTVTGIDISDKLMAAADKPAAFDLAPEASKVIKYTYTVTQADVDAGKVVNAVTASGSDPDGDDVEGDTSVEVPAEEQTPALTVTKAASKTSNVAAGEEITYTVTVTNSGNVTVSSISLADTLVDLKEAAFALAPGEEKVVTYKYTATQADVDAGSFTNEVTATGKDPKGEDVTQNASVTVSTEESDSALSITKTADPDKDVEVGDTINYTVVVKNEGNVTLNNIQLEDKLMAAADAPEAFRLAPGASKTVTYEYTVTQADVDAQEVVNLAKANGKDPKGNDAGEVTASVTVPTVKKAPHLTVEKTADPDKDVAAGDKITYTVVVTNDGNVTIDGIEIDDSLVDVNVDAFSLAPGANKTITYEYTVTQADVDKGSVKNAVTATGKDPDDKPTPGDDEIDTPTEEKTPKLTVKKTADPAEGAGVGDKITYTVVAKNEGNVTIKGIKLEDTLVEIDEAAFDLVPGASKTVTYEYTVTQADVDKGSVKNAVTAKGTDPDNKPTNGGDEITTPTEEKDPELTVKKTANPSKGAGVGDKITYTVVVTNTGNVTIDGIEIDDSLVDVNVDAFTLAPGANKTITYEYTVTQADVDKGSVKNAVTAKGTNPDDKPTTGGDEIDTQTEEKDPKLTVKKTADPAKGAGVGDKITYTVVAKNEGNVTIKGIKLEDTLVEIEEDAFDLAPGASKTVTYEYTVTQADVDAGSVKNAVTAKGTDPDNKPTNGGDEITTPTEEKDPKLTVKKTADPAKGAGVGDKITYTVVVTNDGNVTVDGIRLDDTLVEIDEDAFTLAPGANKTITYEYTVTQADVDKGSVKNAVTATGNDPGDDPVPGDDEITTPTEEADPSIEVTKVASQMTNAKVGDTVNYTVTVKNTGNVTVSDIALNDTLVKVDEESFVLAPGQERTVSYEYTVTQDDIDEGTFNNKVTAEGKSPDGEDVTDTAEVTVSAEEADAALKIEKTAAPTENVAVGDIIEYTVTVTNIGNVTVSDITVADSLVTLDEQSFKLAPAASKEFKYTYVVTQADVDKHQVANTATANGNDPKGNPVDEVTASAVVKTVEKDSRIEVSKTADREKDLKVNDVVNYTVTVKNTGNVTVSDITLDDSLVNVAQAPFTLAPGAVKEIKYSYTVTQADVDAGSVKNAVTVKGDDPDKDPVPGEDDVTVPTEEKDPKLTVEKTANPTNNVGAGDVIVYTIKVTNSGNVTVRDITAEDTLVDLDVEAFSLAPGATKEITYRYTVTQADVNAGSVKNAVTVKGSDPDKDPVPGEDEVTVPTETAAPAITVTKTANDTTDLTLGTVVRYTVTVRNSGNVSLTGIRLNDSLVNVGGGAFALEPGETRSFSYNYTVTQANVDAGRVVNTATATGTAPDGSTATGRASVTATTAAPAPTPTPGGGGGPGIVPGPGAPVPAAAPAPAVIDNNPVPADAPEPEVIDDVQPPLAEGTWALINLICAALATLGALVALFRKKEEEDEEEENAAKKYADDEEDEDDNRTRNMTIAKVLGVIAAIASVVAFILTEDMSLPMVLTDKWTLLMALLFAGQAGTAVANKKASELDDEDEEEGAQA